MYANYVMHVVHEMHFMHVMHVMYVMYAMQCILCIYVSKYLCIYACMYLCTYIYLSDQSIVARTPCLTCRGAFAALRWLHPLFEAPFPGSCRKKPKSNHSSSKVIPQYKHPHILVAPATPGRTSGGARSSWPPHSPPS